MSVSLIILSWLLLSIRLSHAQLISYFQNKFLNSKQQDDHQILDEVPSEEPPKEYCHNKFNPSIDNDSDQFTEDVSKTQSNLKNLSRQRGSIMLNDGSCHEVWKPGKKLVTYSNSISDRKFSLYSSIKKDTGMRKTKPNSDKNLMEMRQKQWQKLEAEAVTVNSIHVDTERSFTQSSDLQQQSSTDSELYSDIASYRSNSAENVLTTYRKNSSDVLSQYSDKMSVIEECSSCEEGLNSECVEIKTSSFSNNDD